MKTEQLEKQIATIVRVVNELDKLGETEPTGTPTMAEHPYNIGNKYFIRTVTMHHTGVLARVTDKELVLKDAAWIADSGRLQQALESGDFAEVEMFPSGRVIIGRGAIIDATEITTIPTAQK